MIAAIHVPKSRQRQVVPKHGMTFEEFSFAVGSEDLAKRMRKAGWIKPVCDKPMLFDAGDVAACWAQVCNGEMPK